MGLNFIRRWILFFLVIGYLLLVIGCQSQPPPRLPPTTPAPTPVLLHVGLDESAAAIPTLLSSLPANIQFITNNNAALLDDLSSGQLDAILTHHIPPGDGHWFNPVALDGLAIIVHPDNPVTELSLAEVQAIFSGKIGNWSLLGGADSPIVLVSRERGSGARVIFNERVMGAQRLAITAEVAGDQAQVLEKVAGDAAAIGYVMMGSMGDGVRPLILDGYAPTPNNTASQNYPLTAPLYFLNATSDEPQGELRAFLAWLQSVEGQEMLGQTYGRVR